MADKTLREAMDFISREAQENVLDALRSTMRNTAQTIGGNTPESDVEWFADFLYRGSLTSNTAWSHLEESERNHWRRTAASCIEALPYLMDRIKNRYDTYSKVLQDMAREAREAKYAASTEAR